MTDAISEFLSAMASAGIHPLEPITNKLGNGELVRFRAEGDKPGRMNGWAVLHQGGLPAGAFGHYRLGIHAVWRSGNARDLTRDERQAIIRRIAEAEAKRHSEAEAAASAAVEEWAGANRASKTHRYLAGKHLSAFGVRQKGNLLLVPMVDQRFNLMNLQRIAPDGNKRFLKGGRTAGLFWPHATNLIDGRPAPGPIVIGEGYATMAAIHEATGYGVAAAMSATNLLPVTMAMRRMFPLREIIVAADNDGHLPDNRGLIAAQKAADAAGAVVATPVMAGADGAHSGIGVDFADIPRTETARLIELARYSDGQTDG